MSQPKYADMKREDMQRADQLLRHAEEICRYWHLAGSERGIARIRTRLIRVRHRLLRDAR